jgi:hypothetical protein
MGTHQEKPVMSDIVEQLEIAEDVGRLFLKGKNVTQISRELDLQPKVVTKALANFKSLLKKNAETVLDIKDRMMDILFESDEAFRMVIEEGWNTVSQADINAQYGTKVQALKLIESSTKNRADMLQKVGMSQDTEIIEHINEVEEKQAMLISLLKEIKDEYPEVAELIASRLSRIQAEVEVIRIEP